MSQVLRQSTQVVVVVGPFVDVADGFTPETGITLSGADEAELLKANTATTTDISGATWAAITGCDGWYALTLTTTLTDTVGPLSVMVNDDSVCLPVFARFQVIEEAAYDAIYAASAAPATAAGVSAVETDTQDIQSKIGTPAGASVSADIAAIEAQTDDIGAAGAGLTAVPWNAAWDAEVQSEVADALAVYDPPTHAELVSETDAVQTDVAAVKADTAAILTDTGTTLQGELDAIEAAVITNAAGVDIAADIIALKAVADSILVDTGTTLDGRIPAALVGGRMDASVGAMAANVMTASAAAADLTTELQSGLSTLDAAGVRTAVGLASANLDTQLAAIQADTDNIQTRIPAALSAAGNMKADIKEVSDTAITGDGSTTPWGPV